MIENFENEKALSKLAKCNITMLIILGIWLCLPPFNKLAQISEVANTVRFNIAQISNETAESEYIYHHNSAINLALMDKPYKAIKEFDLAIETLPQYMNESYLNKLYKERADLKLYVGDLEGALEDFLRLPDPCLVDKFKVGIILRELGKNKLAVEYCNWGLYEDSRAYIGYACIADVYARAGKYKTAIRIYDLLISRDPKKGQYYMDRAKFKEADGDLIGYEADYEKAKSLIPNINKNYSIIDEILHPKKLNIQPLKV